MCGSGRIFDFGLFFTSFFFNCFGVPRIVEDRGKKNAKMSIQYYGFQWANRMHGMISLFAVVLRSTILSLSFLVFASEYLRMVGSSSWTEVGREGGRLIPGGQSVLKIFSDNLKRRSGTVVAVDGPLCFVAEIAARQPALKRLSYVLLHLRGGGKHESNDAESFVEEVVELEPDWLVDMKAKQARGETPSLEAESSWNKPDAFDRMMAGRDALDTGTI